MAHKTAALTLTGHELAAFTNFTPGAGIFLNEWFYLPVWVSALLIAFVAAASPSALVRWMGGALAAAVASLGLPPYPQVLSAVANADYRMQFLVTVVVMLAAVAISVLRLSLLRLRPGVAATVLALFGLIAAVPWAGFLAVRPAVEQLYRDTTGLGFGWWVVAAGALITLLAGARVLQSSQS